MATGERLLITSLLSQALVARTIEQDDELEHRAPHRTSDHGPGSAGDGPWLISTALYVGFLRLVPDDGVRMADLAAASGAPGPVHPAYHGMRRWGYVTATPDIPTGAPRKRDGDALVALTPPGLAAREQWAEVAAALEERWAARGLVPLRDALVPVAEQLERPLPEAFPMVDYLLAAAPVEAPSTRPAGELGLLALLSQVLLALTYDIEALPGPALVVCADLLRVLGSEPVPVRDLPSLTGVSKATWESAVGRVEKFGLIDVVPSPRGRGKAVCLTERGVAAREDHGRRVAQVEAAWRERVGRPLDVLRAALEAHVGDGTPAAPVFEGLGQRPDGWRAKLPPLAVLPHHPVVTHRGGYPDGS